MPNDSQEEEDEYYDEEYDDEEDLQKEDNNAQEIKAIKNTSTTPKINLNLTEVKPFLP